MGNCNINSDGTHVINNITGFNSISIELPTEFVLLTSEPDDWETNFLDYYKKDDRYGGYALLNDTSAPNWEANKYYYSNGVDFYDYNLIQNIKLVEVD